MAFLSRQPAPSLDIRGREAREAQGYPIPGGRLRNFLIISSEAGHGGRTAFGQKPQRITGMKRSREEEPGRDGSRPGQAEGAIEGDAHWLRPAATVLGEARSCRFQGLPEGLEARGVVNAGGDHGGRRKAIAFQERFQGRSRGLLLRFAGEVAARQGHHEARKGKALETS